MMEKLGMGVKKLCVLAQCNEVRRRRLMRLHCLQLISQLFVCRRSFYETSQTDEYGNDVRIAAAGGTKNRSVSGYNIACG